MAPDSRAQFPHVSRWFSDCARLPHFEVCFYGVARLPISACAHPSPTGCPLRIPLSVQAVVGEVPLCAEEKAL